MFGGLETKGVCWTCSQRFAFLCHVLSVIFIVFSLLGPMLDDYGPPVPWTPFMEHTLPKLKVFRVFKELLAFLAACLATVKTSLQNVYHS